MKRTRAAARVQPSLQQLVLIHATSMAYYLSVIGCMQVAESLHFKHSSFSNGDLADLKFVKEDSWYEGQGAFATGSEVWLTPDPRDEKSTKYNNLGRVVYKNAIQFMSSSTNKKKVASFNTSFSFQIITCGAYGMSGAGMTFFISDSEKSPKNSHKRGLGLVSPDYTNYSFFAVEFDTHLSDFFSTREEEPSYSHIGIDINSLKSLTTIDTSPYSHSGFYPQLYLYNNSTFTAWIEYISSSHLIQVWMTNSTSSTRPPRPCLNLSYDLSTVFHDFMYVGFSAANSPGELLPEGHVLFSWSFSSEDLITISKPPIPNISPKHHKLLLVPLTVSVSILLGLGILSIIFFSILRRRRRKNMSINRTVYLGLQNRNNKQLASTPRYSYNELRRAAHGFTDQNKVGEGGYSSVYRATLADGSSVAIKKLKEGVRKEAEFSAEMNIISSIRHRNLLELQGWCYEKGEAMLVYKYMSNGSLDQYLYGGKRGTLQSDTRLRILEGVALALDYLHGGLGECVLHRDVKAANVLLAENFEPMLGDFGLARLIGHDQGSVTMTAAGTPGYVAPEVVYAGKATDRADVYSFGVLALEIACGRPAMNRSNTAMRPEEVRLVDWVWHLHQGNQLMDAIDPSMCRDDDQMPPGEKERWRCVLHVALMCCSPSPESRPSMRQVSQALEGDTMLVRQPLPITRPLYPTSPNSLRSASRSSTSGNVTVWTPLSLTGR